MNRKNLVKKKNNFKLFIYALLIFTLFNTSAFSVPNTPSIPNTNIDSAINTMHTLTEELAQKNKELEIIGENNAFLEIEMQKQQKKLELVNQEIAATEQEINILQSQVATLAIISYKEGSFGYTNLIISALFESKTFSEALTKLDYAKRAYEQEQKILKKVSAKKSQLNTTKQNQTILTQNLALFQRQYEQEKEEINSRVTELNFLQKNNQKVLDAIHAAERTEQLQYLAKISDSLNTTETISSARKAVVDTALAQLGKPYVWGATGPNTFDCSGLMVYSYKSININMVRTSRQQYQITKRVELKDLKPGDFVFIGETPETIHHVMMYIGDGYTIEAPQTGDVVKIQPLEKRISSIIGYGTIFINGD